MSSIYRYPGPRPFETDEANVFFGREKDIERLIQQLKLTNLLVLYAKSGLGKSSILNAGLLPRIAEEQMLQPFSIRFQAYQKGEKNNVLPLEKVRQQLNTNAPLLDRIYTEENKSLWHLLKAHQLQQKGSKGILLLFDQFEELFTYPAKTIEVFAQQLSEVLYTTIPDRYRQGLESLLQKTKHPIPNTELKDLHQPFTLRVIMAIRSDRYSLLDRLKSFIPTLLESTYELQALNRQKAEDAILNPAYEKNGFASSQFDFEDSAVDHLIDFLSQDIDQKIESFQLQILCEYIERELVLKRRQDLYSKTGSRQSTANTGRLLSQQN